MAVLVPLITLVLGAILGGLSKAVQDRYSAFKESQVVAAALRAELRVLLGAIERGQHLENLGRTISYLRGLTSPPTPDDVYEVMKRTQDYYSVFHAHCGKLGMLADAAEPVVAAYTMFKVLDDDLSGIVERHRSRPFTLTQLVRAYESSRELLQEAVEQARVAAAKLTAHEQRRFRLWGSPGMTS